MMRRTNGWVAGLAALLVACGGGGKGAAVTPVTATDSAAAAGALEPALPIDKRITVGKLDNGLTYYILPHRKPEKRAQLWLGVDAGSVLEDDDQQGLAHFVEHMAFNGTARFPKMELVNYLERIGMKFGPDLNAYTSFDETVYMLQVPTDDGALVDKGFDILRDWAGGVTLDPVEVDKERGVVTEEWRLGRGAGMRILDKQFPVLFAGSRYAVRLPIGKPEILKGAPQSALARYYKDWYRPDLMTVIAVGDFDPKTIEAAIKGRFADLKNPAQARPRPPTVVAPHADTKVSIEPDPEMPQTIVQIYDKIPHQPERTARDYRRLIADQLYHSMLNARLDEIRRQKDAPFLFAGSSTGNMVRGADAFSRVALFKEGGVDRALSALFEEVLRVERHGFTAAELERAKAEILRGYQRSVAERDKRDAREFAAEILRNFLEGEMMPGIEAELALVEKFLPTYTVAELNGLAKKWGEQASRVILISGPASMKKPTVASVMATIKAVEGKTIAAYDDGQGGGALMAATPAPRLVVDEKTIPEIGVTEWRLANGIRVVLKPTDFQNDAIVLSSFSPGGSSRVSDADYPSARFLGEILDDSGVGEIDPVALRKLMAGKVASARLQLGELEEGVFGRASPRDAETMFQLVHLKLTRPRRDEQAFATWKAAELEDARNRRLSPERSFFEDVATFTAQNHRRRQPTTPELIEQVSLDKVMKLHADRFGDLGDSTFVLVGNLDLAAIKPLVERYLGSLPSRGGKEKWKDVGVRFVRGKKEKEVRLGSEPKSMVTLLFHGPDRWSHDAENDLEMLEEVLRIRLREVLREDMGGVYGARVSATLKRRPRVERQVSIGFGCAPENVERLEKAVFDEIAAIKKNGIGDDYLAKVKEGRRRAHELELKENSWWAGELEDAYRYGEDPRKIDDEKEMIEKITSARVQAAARRFLGTEQYVLGVLRPAGGASAAAAPAAPATPAR